MRVLKFGGTSVKDPEAIGRLIGIVRTAREGTARDRPDGSGPGPLVVVSALSKVTDSLLKIAERATAGEAAAVTELVEGLRRRHHDTLAGVVTDARRQAAVAAALDAELAELGTLAHSLSVLREASPRLQDAIAATGELLSSRIVAAALEDAGLPAQWVDARTVLVTDAATPAQPNMEATAARCREQLLPLLAQGAVPVLGGFIGSTASGVTTTLGRGGSDYSASIFGVGINAGEIQIWTDVDGMLTADPRVLDGTRTVPRLSFDEASELAYFGAKVLHPSTIFPAVTKDIPVRILNSQRPDGPGTLITRAITPRGDRLAAIACKQPVTVIDIVSTRMLMAHGFLRRLFEVFERHETAVDVVTTSEVSVSVTIDNNRRLDAIVRDLSTFADVTTTGDMALVCAVGETLRTEPALPARVVGALEGLPIRMVSQAGSRRNVTVVLPHEHLVEAMRRLHDRFCVSTAEPEAVAAR
ncbi:MAG TPA: aspartate kinase [Vicinamibacterales bacterium]